MSSGYYRHDRRTTWRKRGHADPNRRSLPSLAEFKSLIQRNHKNLPGAREELSRMLDDHPQIWQTFGNAGKHVETMLIGLIAGSDPLLIESLQREQRAMRRRLLGKSKCPLEKLAVERVLISRLELAYADMVLLSYERGRSILKVANHLQKQRIQAQRSYDQAMRGLLDLRRLLPQKSKTAVAEPGEKKPRPFPIEWKLPQPVLDRISPKMTPSAASELDD